MLGSWRSAVERRGSLAHYSGPGFTQDVCRSRFSPRANKKQSPEMDPLGRRQEILVALLHAEGVIPGILVAGGTDHPELGHGMLVGHGLGADGAFAHLGPPHLAEGQKQ